MDGDKVAIVEPLEGRVMGVAWASAPGDLLRRYEEVRRVRHAGDVMVYSLTYVTDSALPPVEVTATYSLDRLVSVDLRVAPGGEDGSGRSEFRRLVAATLACFEGSPAEGDLGYDELVEATARVTVDLLDGRVRLEEVEG